MTNNPNLLFATEMGPMQMAWSRVKSAIIRFRRRFVPYLVWWGDEVDVRVTLVENTLTATDMDGALQQLHQGSFYKAEMLLHECGIGFDTGMGMEGRDWEWDFSLRGPIHVTFKGRSTCPERRG